MKNRSELSAREVDSLHTSLARRLGDTTIPSLPQVAMKIIGLVSDPDSTIKQFAEVISTDQALTGRLLRMANSAAFGQRGPVSNVDRAMVLLGLERLKALALGFHLSQAAASDSSKLGFRSMWTQSLFRACVAMRLAERFNKSLAGEAFVIGFMSDAGVPIMPELVGEDYPGTDSIGTHPTKLFKAELARYEQTHIDIMMAMARIWKLPERLTVPIGLHHAKPERCDLSNDASLLHTIAFFVGGIPLTPAGGVESAKASFSYAREFFAFDQDMLRDLYAKAGTDFETYRSLFADLMSSAMSIDHILDEANKYVLEDDNVVDRYDDTSVVQAGGMTLTLSRSGPERVSVEVTDAGEPMVCEQVNLRAIDEQDLRSRLLIDDATPDEYESLRSALFALAA